MRILQIDSSFDIDFNKDDKLAIQSFSSDKDKKECEKAERRLDKLDGAV